jgi:MarR family transcriptional regulator, 2-MHQ and catechol-resistance regulon repressor
MTLEGPTPKHPAARLKLALWRANKQVERVEILSLKDRGLGLSDFAILEALLHKGPLPVNIIGQKVLLTSGSITSAVQRLRQRGLLTRTPADHDKRVMLIGLTEAGRTLIEEQFAAHLQCLERIASVLSSEECDTLISLLKKVGHHTQALKIDLQSPAPSPSAVEKIRGGPGEGCEIRGEPSRPL